MMRSESTRALGHPSETKLTFGARSARVSMVVMERGYRTAAVPASGVPLQKQSPGHGVRGFGSWSARCSEVEVETDAPDIFFQAVRMHDRRVGERNGIAVGAGGIHRPQIDMQIFELDRPLGEDHPLHATADRPTGLGT